MRQRRAHDDPLAIFERPLQGRDKPLQSTLPLPFVQRCCNRRNRRQWLCYTWVFIIFVMTTISYKVFHQVYPDGPTSLADSILSLYFKTAWKLKRNRGKKNRYNKNKTVKKILYYNNYWNFPHFQFGEAHRPFVDAQCPVHDCVAVQYRPSLHTNEYLSSLDAVLIHAPEFNAAVELPKIAQWRKPHQRFIYMNMESPLSHSNSMDRRLNHFFNWTMTYRLDSDLPRPYGFFELSLPNLFPGTTTKQGNNNKYYPVQWKQKQDFLPYNQQTWLEKVLPNKPPEFHQLATRPKKVAWIVSRCDSPSHREDYVSELQKYISVDILGACGSIPCNASFATGNTANTATQQQDNCTTAVHRDYKFYLALENSLCQDYVTEKFFQRMAGPSVVVVLGGANYTAPPHSHLNALDFESPQALAEKLHELDQNPAHYLSYFWWKDYYQVHTGTAEDHASTMCRLCQLLHEPQQSPKVYSNIASWHGEKSQCQQELPPAIQKVAKYVATDDDGRLLDD